MSSNLAAHKKNTVIEIDHKVPRAAVEAQLQRMLASPEFQRALRPARFLEFAVHRVLDAPNEPLVEAEIAKAVYDRRDFDPKLDPIVRVEAARLRRRIQEYYRNSGASDPIAIHLPQRGYLPEIRSRQDSEMERSRQDDDNSHTSDGSTTIQLAVLPFADLSDDSHLPGFCSGLTEEVIACLTDLAGVSVVSRTSATLYEGEPVDLRSVGKELGVTHALEGSVRQGETQYRVTAKLIDCATGFTLWSKTLQADCGTDPLQAQELLAGLIAETLADRGEQPAEPENPA